MLARRAAASRRFPVAGERAPPRSPFNRLLTRGSHFARARAERAPDHPREVAAVLESAFEPDLHHVEVGVLQEPARTVHAQLLPVLRRAEADVVPEAPLELPAADAERLA